MRRIYILAGMLTLTAANAQHHGVGINNTTPEATLDISISTSAAPGAKQGLLLPRITKKDLADINNPVVSTLIYVKEGTAAVAGATVTEVNADGFYYFYNGKWRKVSPDVAQYLSSESVKLVNNEFQRAALTGDVTAVQNSNAVTINNGTATNGKIATNAVTTDKIANGTIKAEDLSDMGALEDQLLTFTETGWEPAYLKAAGVSYGTDTSADGNYLLPDGVMVIADGNITQYVGRAGVYHVYPKGSGPETEFPEMLHPDPGSVLLSKLWAGVHLTDLRCYDRFDYDNTLGYILHSTSFNYNIPYRRKDWYAVEGGTVWRDSTFKFCTAEFMERSGGDHRRYGLFLINASWAVRVAD